jgi:acyl-coenzyme A synthetase/AMP-(fatty) acid ligase
MADVVDETGKDVPWGQGGILVIKKPWPSMIRTIYGDPERFKKSYYPEEFQGKYYLAGDGAIRDEKTGYFTITGRIDDVLNVSGHRMGTMEIESALVSHTTLVAEAAVVGRPDETTGEAICAFVVLKRTGRPATRPRRSPRSCATGSASRSARSPSRRTSASATTCRRHRSGKIMRRCCVRSRRAGDHAGHLDAREPGDPGAAVAKQLSCRFSRCSSSRARREAQLRRMTGRARDAARGRSASLHCGARPRAAGAARGREPSTRPLRC